MAVAVSVGVTVGVAVGLGVWVMVGVGVGGKEVGLGTVGIGVGKGKVGLSANPMNAIIEKQNRTNRTARMHDCGRFMFKKVFLCLLGEVGMQEPFTGLVLCKQVPEF